MNKKKMYRLLGSVLCILGMASVDTQVIRAAETDNDTKIIIEATDDNTRTEDLQYAIGDDNPESFSSNNIFEVKKGEGYIVYVKDLAGNISSRIVVVDDKGNVTTEENPKDNSKSENKDKDKSKNSSSKSKKDNNKTSIEAKPISSTNAGTATVIPDTNHGNAANAGNASTSNSGNISNRKGTGSTVDDSRGEGTVIEETDGNEGECTKSFYTIESENGYIYYLIIDHAESEENVYFLDKVKEEDLINLAERETEEETEEEKTELFSKEPQEPETEIEEVQEEPEKPKQGNNYIMIVVVMLAVLGAGYYVKIYKPKHKMLDDAYDLEEDFEAVEDSELEEKETFIPHDEEETEEKV